MGAACRRVVGRLVGSGDPVCDGSQCCGPRAAALPAALAAVTTNCPLALVEPNAIPGRANRLTARFARRVFVGFPEAGQRLGDRTPTEHRGIPLRRALVDAFEPHAPRGVPETPLHLLVFGGSQGALQINEAMMTLAPRLAGRPLEIFHQAGAADRARVQAAYSEAGVDAEVVDFEPAMPARYRWAHLALCRSGALTVAELALAGLPALLIPYPFAADDHQAANAAALSEAGAALRMEAKPLDVDGLGSALLALVDDPSPLSGMSAAASALARPAAARDIVEACARLAQEGRA